jgi:hypothetical protein
MTDLPEPLNTITSDWPRGPVPIDLDAIMHDFEWAALSDRQFRARLFLLARSWGSSDAPGGSLCGDINRYFRASPEKIGWWKKNVATVIGPWVKCSDGNYYHPYLCAEAGRRATRAASRLDVTGSAWSKLRKEVFERDGHRCTYCGETPPRLHCDHIIPVIRGGLSTIDNLTTACADCNLSKSDSILEDWLQK